jgi:hypothetical protein
MFSEGVLEAWLDRLLNDPDLYGVSTRQAVHAIFLRMKNARYHQLGLDKNL